MDADGRTEARASASVDEAAGDTAQIPFEFYLIRYEDNVRAALVILLLIAALTTPSLVTNRVAAYTSLIVGVFLTLWTRYVADWRGIRVSGKLGIGALVVVLADYAWLALLAIGTGGARSPFHALLMVPILFAVAVFARQRVAVGLVTGLVMIAYFGLAIRSEAVVGWQWQLGGQLLTVMALAAVAYGMCVVLERERRTNELVIRHMSDAVILVDGGGLIALCNGHLQRFTGVAREAVLGKHTRELQSDDRFAGLAAVLADVGTVGRSTEPIVRELEMALGDAEPVDVRVATVPYVAASGGVLGWVVVCSDVTAIKSLIRLKEQGIAMLSHEIQSPLTTLKIASEMLTAMEHTLPERDIARFAEVIGSQTERLIGMAADCLNASSLDEPDFAMTAQETDVSALVRLATQESQQKAADKGIAVSCEVADHIPGVMMDGQRIADALARLCDNAIKYTAPGGEVLIEASRADNELHISVTDTGQGVPPDQLESVFEKYSQLEDHSRRDKSERGVGLGLYVVKRTAELHGGRVDVVSEVGRGSTFTICLPIPA